MNSVIIPTTTLGRSGEFYELNKAKGFWDKGLDENVPERVMLMVSEAGEALEALRNNRRADIPSFEAELKWHENGDPAADTETYINSFRRYVKDTFEDELADTVIRLCDFIGAYDLFPGELPAQFESYLTLDKIPDNGGEALLTIVRELLLLPQMVHHRRHLSDAIYKDQFQKLVRASYMIIYLVAMKHNIDLDRHVNLKLFYNKTRPYKHGKAF